MDEVALSGATRIVEWTGERIIEFSIEPEMFGLTRCAVAAVAGADAHANAALLRSILDGQAGPHRDIVLLNAALALYIAGTAADLGTGFALAGASIDSGAARRKLETLIEASR